MSNSKYLAAVALALAHWPSTRADLIPYSDSSCTQPVTITDSSGTTYTSLSTGGGISDFDDPAFWIFGATYSTSAASGSSNVDLWWSIENVGDGCRNALLIDYSQGQYGSMGQIVAPGNVMLNGDSGCIYSSVPVGRDVGAAFCCGSGDCNILGLGNDALLAKRDDGLLLSAREPLTEEPKTRIAKEKLASRNEVAAARSEKRDDPDDWAGTCTAVDVNGPYPQAAPQTIVANTQTCTSSPCDFAISQAISSQYTLTSTTTQTITNGFGLSVGVSTGFDFIIDFEAEAGASYEWSRAVAEATGTSLTTANTTTVTNTVGQYTGTTAFATFTGTFTCYDYSLDCGAGISDPLTFCTPSFIGEGSGQTLEGDYNVVYLV